VHNWNENGVKNYKNYIYEFLDKWNMPAETSKVQFREPQVEYNWYILRDNKMVSGFSQTQQYSIKVLFIQQLMHKWVVLKNNIKIYIKTAPTFFGAVTPSSGSALIRAYWSYSC
jgi:hypothetical protein